MSRLCIIGAGGHGKVVADLALRMDKWDSISFLDEYHDPGSVVAGCLVEGTLECLPTLAMEDVAVVVAIGDNVKRLALMHKCQQWQLPLATIIHPSAYVSDSTHIGAGTVIMANAVVNIDAKIGRGCIINSGAVVEHECELGEGVHISPNAVLAGQVEVGAKTWIGMGACVKERTKIGMGVRIGAGSVVLKDLPDFVTAVGSPANIISTKETS